MEKPFNINEINNYNCYTKSGRPVRIICTNRKDKKTHGSVVSLVSNKSDTYEQVVCYDKNGVQVNGAHELDLILSDE